VRLDGKADKIERQRLQTDLRRLAQVREVTQLHSHAEVLIQMADMIAGAIRVSCVASRTDATVYKSLIAHRLVDEWVLPA
jgi:hypothetical protein